MYGTMNIKNRLRVFENRVLTKRDEVTGDYSRQYNEEFNDLYSSANVIRCIKPRRINRTGHVAGMRERGKLNAEFLWRY
jgi:hypothetical protein